MKNYLLLSLFIMCGLLLNAQITVSPSSGCAGSSFTVTISGLPTGVSSGCSANPGGGLTPSGGGSVILAGTNVTAVASGGGSTATATITIPANFTPGTYGFSYTASNLNLSCAPSTNSCNSCFTVLVVPAQPGSISGNATPCSSASQTYSITPVSGATSYTWTLPNGWTGSSTTSSITVTTGASGGTISVTANNTCGSSTARTLAVTIATAPAQPGTISGSATPCNGSSQTYSVTPVNGATSYTWTLPGTYSGTSTTASINATIGATGGTISVTANNTCGSSTARTLAVTTANAPAQPGTISGTAAVCPGSSQTYSVTPVNGATAYTWTMPNGWTGTSTTSSITTTVGNAGGTISVTANNTCGASTARTLSATIAAAPSQPGTVSGATNACNGASETYSVTPVNGAAFYTWTLPNGWSGTSTSSSISATVGAAGGNVSVTAGNSCGSSTASNLSISVDNAPAQPGAITGANNVCSGVSQTYSISPVSGAISYTWTLPADWTGTSTANSISATTGVTPGNVSVTANNSCGASAAQSLAVTFGNSPAQPGTVTGNTNLCAGNTETYTISPVNGATSYQWTVPNNWTGSSTTTSITVTVDNNSGQLFVSAVNNCGASTPRAISLQVDSAPADIEVTPAGAQNICTGNDITLSCIGSNIANYQWQLDGNDLQNETNSSYLATAAGTYTCVASNTCGNSPSGNNVVISIVGAPTAASVSPAGTTGICTGTSQTLTCTATGATSYQWVLDGADINGEVASTYVASTAGTYTCKALNSCGTITSVDSAVIEITSTPTAPNLTSSLGDSLCLGDSTVISAALGYTTYVWSNGETTNSIKVGAAGSYVVTVSSTCGTVASNPYQLTVNTPVQPVITANGNVLQSSVAGVSYIWFLNAITVDGANAQTYTPTQNGPYSVRVTDENGCAATSAPFNFVQTGISSTLAIAGLQLFPNPATGFVTIKFDGQQALQLTITTASGQQVLYVPNVTSNTTIDLSKMARGVYFIKLSEGSSQAFKKLVIGE